MYVYKHTHTHTHTHRGHSQALLLVHLPSQFVLNLMPNMMTGHNEHRCDH